MTNRRLSLVLLGSLGMWQSFHHVHGFVGHQACHLSRPRSGQSREPPCNNVLRPLAPPLSKTPLSSMTPPSTLLTATSEETLDTVSSSTSILDMTIHSPVFWSFNVMLVIIFLLYTWEKGVEYAREETPPALVPVLERILGEMAGLGFIALFVSAVLNQAALGESVGHLSEEFLGNEEILLETFEFIHEVFFQSAMAFFFAAAFIIVNVLNSFQSVIELTDNCDKVAAASPNPASSGFVSCEVAGILKAPSIQKASRIGQFLSEDDPETKFAMEEAILRECDESENPVWRELRLTRQERGAETLVLRERVKFEFGLPADYKIYTYLQEVFASAQLDIVEVSPLSWLPLVPAIALAIAVDQTHGVVNPTVANAVESSGFFLSTPWFFVPKMAIEVLCLVWGLLNFWKIANIKAMLVPKVVRLEGDEGMGQLLAPDVEKVQLRREWQAKSTPALVAPLEGLYAEPPMNRVQELFGVIGGNGLEFYLSSIKYHTWLTVISLVVFTSQILPRDVFALTHMDILSVGNPENLLPEIAVFSFFAVLNLTMLSLQPTVFLNYCLISFVEDNVKKEGVNEAQSVRVIPVDNQI